MPGLFQQTRDGLRVFPEREQHDFPRFCVRRQVAEPPRQQSVGIAAGLGLQVQGRGRGDEADHGERGNRKQIGEFLSPLNILNHGHRPHPEASASVNNPLYRTLAHDYLAEIFGVRPFRSR